MDAYEEEEQLEQNTFAETAATVAVAPIEASRLLIVATCKEAAALLTRLPRSDAGNSIKAVVMSNSVKTERNSWNCSVGTGAGAILHQVSPGVFAVDLSTVDLDLSYVDLTSKLFASLGPLPPSDGVLILDRKIGFVSTSAMDLDDSDDVASDLPALIQSSASPVKEALSRFPTFLPPNVLTGWSAAILTHCESKSIPCYSFISRVSNPSVFSEAKILEHFAVTTTNLTTKMAGLTVNSDAGKPELSSNALFL
ncbi:hypothetical protein BDR26DRAFT_929250 [Obelidium mucronatum]|nr:hypothetical protein BDR26DRAFT_929250 [Obelidium mucronatum]